jgi:hypothetical protein
LKSAFGPAEGNDPHLRRVYIDCSDWNQVIGTCSFRLGRIEEEVEERKSRETLDQITLGGRCYELANKRGDFVFDFLVFESDP